MRRARWTIAADILRTIKEGESRVSRVAAKANVSHDRLCHYLDKLERANLVETEPTLSVTSAGEGFLQAVASAQRTYENAFGDDE